MRDIVPIQIIQEFVPDSLVIPLGANSVRILNNMYRVCRKTISNPWSV